MKAVQYQCECDYEISNNQLAALVRLYQPVFTVPALSLYLTFYEWGRARRSLTLEMLCSITQNDIDTIISQRQELERFMLVRTFESEGVVTVVVQKPLTMAGFISHPMFGRLYALVQGSDAYKQVSVECAGMVTRIEGDEITKPFDAARLSAWNTGMEDAMEVPSNSVVAPHFDVDRFFSTMSDAVYPMRLRTESLKRIVAESGSLYQISYPDMKSFLFNATNFAMQSVDEVKLIHIIDKACKVNNAVPKQIENPYELDPMRFLQFKQNHAYIVDADRKLIESLSKNFGFSNPVINALLEYVLEVNQDNLNRGYVEKIASTWKRRNVETLEDALKEISKPVRKKQPVGSAQKTTVIHTVPEYSKDDSIDEDVDALRQLLKEQLAKGGSS